MKIKLLILILTLVFATSSFSQELNCQVEINSTQVQGSANKQIFDQLKRSILEFMNNTKWTTETFTQQEKIECYILIVIKEAISTEDYSGTIQISSGRPVFKSSFSAKVLNIEDEYFQFKFQQFSQLEYNMNTFQNNLTSVLQYYAYVVLASDYDTFAPQGGTAYWQKAQLVVQNAQSAAEGGWKQSQTGQKNRYWLVENTLQPLFKGIRECMYSYHMEGLDLMQGNVEEGRAGVLKSLDYLVAVARARPASYNMQLFFNAKRDEIVSIFKGATPEEKTKVMELLSIVDPAGTTKYSKITES